MILRPATFDDEKLLLDWRNDPTVLAVSTDPMPVLPETHHAWFTKIIAHPGYLDAFVWIAEVDGIPVGQGRVERAWKAISPKMDTAVISYSIGKEYRGNGYGKQLVTELVRLARVVHGYPTVSCRIKRANMCSVHVAIAAGINAIELF